jgi:hypothetical protein
MKLEVFDPPMCCSSGVCGVNTNPALVQFAADLEVLKKKGVEVIRHNLSQEPLAFSGNAVVRAALEADKHCLPIVLLNGKLFSQEDYPETGQLLTLTP